MPPVVQEILDKAIPAILQALKLNGLWAWIGTKILNYGGKALLDMGKAMIEKLKRSKSQEEAKKEMDTVKADPNSEAEQEKKATDDFLNS